MSEIKLSEIKRRAQGLQSPVRLAICELVLNDVPHLLDLVKRLGELAEAALEEHSDAGHENEEFCGCDVCSKARALLLEIKQ